MFPEKHYDVFCETRTCFSQRDTLSLPNGQNRFSRMIVILPAYLAEESDSGGPVPACASLSILPVK